MNATEAEQRKTTTEDGSGVEYSINDGFYAEFDAWDGKDTNKVFTIGRTSDALRSVNIKNQEIKMRSGMILKKLSKHPEMSKDIFRKIPELLENPILIQFSDAIDPKTGKQKYDSRITVLGELYADMIVDGKTVQKPVLVSLELLPTNQKKTKILDVSFVTSAYGHSKLQSYLNENSILYIEPNKKRTNKWLSLNRLQLPLGENQTGPIRRITYIDGKVKVQNSTKKTEMQLALEKPVLSILMVIVYSIVRKKIHPIINFPSPPSTPNIYSQLRRAIWKRHRRWLMKKLKRLDIITIYTTVQMPILLNLIYKTTVVKTAKAKDMAFTLLRIKKFLLLTAKE
ncbi:MAG: hypothetical protein IIX54_03985 [Clostridia bacterium]|nr:hypothetical protein [Clostridia bacterium]